MDHPWILIFDKGYPSGEVFIELIERQVKFLVKLGSTSFKIEQNQMDDDDCMVEIVFDKTRINPHRGTPAADKIETTGSITLRFGNWFFPKKIYKRELLTFLIGSIQLRKQLVCILGPVKTNPLGISQKAAHSLDDLADPVQLALLIADPPQCCNGHSTP
ncbi:MAG: hypothetical protein AB1767_13890 [Bacillota bacterium]